MASWRGWTVWFLALLGIVLAGAQLADAADGPGPPGRAFPTSRYAIDAILTRPYDREVPMGCTGDRLWASSPQGWAFANDVHWLYLTNLNAFDVEVSDGQGRLLPDKATYFPSHIHYEGAVRGGTTASASFTYSGDRLENPLHAPFTPERRWTCWSSGHREDWYQIDFGTPRELSGLDIDFFDDAPHGGCRPPESFEVLCDAPGERDGLAPVLKSSRDPARPRPGRNTVRFAPVRSSRVRLRFHHQGPRFYTGIYGLRPIFAEDKPAPAVPLRFSADKFITSGDVLVSVVRVHNPTDQIQTIYVEPIIHPAKTLEHESIGSASGLLTIGGREASASEPRWLELRGRQTLHGFPVEFQFRHAVVDDPPSTLRVSFVRSARGVPFEGFAKPLMGRNDGLQQLMGHHLRPGQTKIFTSALELRPVGASSKLDAVLKAPVVKNSIIRPNDQDRRDPTATQRRAYQAWFDANVPYFDCSDPWLRKMYYHRAYLTRKNMLAPQLGRMLWPTQSEGRWRSSWYANVISYGAGHQTREARWLRDPKYWEGHVRTWAENAKPDGVYPSHVTPQGPADGQYTDWITSTAWDGHLVHPDWAFLASIVDRLAANVRGWQAMCDPDGDGLLMVDSHFWTGMEYQPSFFYFSKYQVSRNFLQPARPAPLERVDLTAYNYGNAVAVSKIERLLGRVDEAREFEALASKIARATLSKMWRPEKQYFYSLRAADDAVADVKEVIGVYPFYFGMVPIGQGHEAAWSAVLDPKQFWTKWPVASVSRECPAYSQTEWPGDGRRSACMWNGPTWPHANSIVMTAMARTLRATRDQKGAQSPLTKQHLWSLFTSFTKAQYRDQDLARPWTGEYYSGDDGHWQTAERDYNHSTWIDVLVPELIGVVPRDDDVLEIDPLLPESALRRFVLDGLLYHGHDLAIVWNTEGPGQSLGREEQRKGLSVYVDGRLAASADHLARLRIDLSARPR